jgi:rod shape determining protein RodA
MARGHAIGVSQRWTEVLRALDPRVLVPAVLLCGVGLLALFADQPHVVAGQARWMVVGMALCVATVVLPYRRMLALIYPAYAVVLLALVAVLIFGREANGAQRWLQLGPFGFQPSEMAKVAVVAVLARYIRFRRDHRTLRGLVVPFLLTLVPLALIVKQPDLGTALMLVPVLFVMLWAAGARSKHLLTVVALGVLSIPLLWTFALQPYQKTRVMTFVTPVVAEARSWVESSGDGTAAGKKTPLDADARAEKARLVQDRKDANYHRKRSMIAVASGGLTGQGFREGTMNRTDAVPEACSCSGWRRPLAR